MEPTLHTFRIEPNLAHLVSISRHQPFLAVSHLVHLDRLVTIWNTDSGSLVTSFTCYNAPVRSLKFSRDGQYLGISTGQEPGHGVGYIGGQCMMYSVDKWQKLFATPPPGDWWNRWLRYYHLVSELSFSPDGSRFATCGCSSLGVHRFVSLWSQQSGRWLGNLASSKFAIRKLDWSSDGNRLVSAGYYERRNRNCSKDVAVLEVCIWDVEAQRCVARTEVDVPVGYMATSIRFSFKSQHIFVAGGTDSLNEPTGLVLVFDSEELGLMESISLGTSFVWSMELSTDGRVLAASMWDGTIGLWDVEDLNLHILRRRSEKGMTSHIGFTYKNELAIVNYDKDEEETTIDLIGDTGDQWMSLCE